MTREEYARYLEQAAQETAQYQEALYDRTVAGKARLNRMTGYIALGAGALIIVLLIVNSQRKAR